MPPVVLRQCPQLNMLRHKSRVDQSTLTQTGARATENYVYTASANLTGKERTKTFYGHSAIAGRGSEKIAQFMQKEEKKKESLVLL